MTSVPPAGARRPIEAVLFDLDGTLLDTIDDIAGSMNAVLARRGLPLRTADEYKLLVGEGVEVLVGRAMAGVPIDPVEMPALVREYRGEYDRRWREHSRPYPGVPELLAVLRARRLRLAVLSNKSHPFTETMTRELLPFPFDVVHGARPGIALKPDPAPALAIAAELGIPPARWAYLGDTDVDMRTAREAGMLAVGVLWGFRGADELRESGAEALLERPLNLLGLLG